MVLGDIKIIFTPSDKHGLFKERFLITTQGRNIVSAFSYKISKNIKPALLRGCVYMFEHDYQAYFVYGCDVDAVERVKYTPVKAITKGNISQELMDSLSDIYIHNLKDVIELMKL
tara:strand:- start:4611 stop:4955 length:345 start_codon:yes stop_codon:yes gene_type:complete